MIIVLNGIGSRVLFLLYIPLSYYFGYCTESCFFEYRYTYIYITCTDCYCMYLCGICAQPSPQRFPYSRRARSDTVSGDNRGCQASVVHRCARNFPFGGFATLSASKMVAERGFTQALPYLDTPLTV